MKKPLFPDLDNSYPVYPFTPDQVKWLSEESHKAVRVDQADKYGTDKTISVIISIFFGTIISVVIIFLLRFAGVV